MRKVPRRPEILPGQVWTGRGASLGRMIRVTGIRDGMVSYEVMAGSNTSKPVRQATILVNYRLSRDPRFTNPVAANGEGLTVHEAQVIASLQRLADRWPATLKVALVNGELRVLHAGQPVQEDSVLEVIRGIPGE